MKIIISGRVKGYKWEEISLDFDSKVTINRGRFNSFEDLVFLKDIEKEINELLCISQLGGIIIITPGLSISRVSMNNVEDFARIRTIVKRDDIINKILKL